MDAIFNRRSIRKYTSQEIPQDLIEKLIRAGMAAPSAGNEQPWHFIVVNDKPLLDEIPKFHPYAKMLMQATCAIVVCGDLSKEVYEGYWVQDCSAATENILIEAQALGLGSVWLGVYPDQGRIKPLQALLGLPETVIPLSILPIGYPAEKKAPASRFNAERIHQNKW